MTPPGYVFSSHGLARSTPPLRESLGKSLVDIKERSTKFYVSGLSVAALPERVDLPFHLTLLDQISLIILRASLILLSVLFLLSVIFPLFSYANFSPLISSFPPPPSFCEILTNYHSFAR
jgi:hypothetical protein